MKFDEVVLLMEFYGSVEYYHKFVIISIVFCETKSTHLQATAALNSFFSKNVITWNFGST